MQTSKRALAISEESEATKTEGEHQRQGPAKRRALKKTVGASTQGTPPLSKERHSLALLRAQAATHGEARARRLERLVEWGKKHKVLGADNLIVKSFPKGPPGHEVMVRGIGIQNAVKKGDLLVGVPQHLVLNSEGAVVKDILKKSALSKETQQKLLRNETALDARVGYRLRLGAALLSLARKEGSLVEADGSQETAWSGWLENLPKLEDYRSFHPVTARKELLKAFQALPVAPVLMQDQDDFVKVWKEFVARGGKATAEEWLWAELVVQTRIWEDGESSLVVPLADTVNTGSAEERNVDTDYGDYQKDKPFGLIASKDIPAGAELIDYYNDGDDDVYIRSWGFPLHLEKVQTALNAEQCKTLGTAVKGSLKDGSCQPPAEEDQKGVFCTLAELAKEHCPTVAA